jgi:hypothetical protein
MNANYTNGLFTFAGILSFALIGIVINVVVCLLLYNALNAIPPQFRRQEPGLVWLLLIPLFHLVWNFFVFPKIGESYRDFFHSIGRADVGDGGRGIGLAFSICAACMIVPCVNIFTGLAALVLLIIFLVKIYNLKGQIPTGGFPPTMPPPAV